MLFIGKPMGRQNMCPTKRKLLRLIWCVLLCFINPILGNRHSPGVSS